MIETLQPGDRCWFWWNSDVKKEGLIEGFDGTHYDIRVIHTGKVVRRQENAVEANKKGQCSSVALWRGRRMRCQWTHGHAADGKSIFSFHVHHGQGVRPDMHWTDEQYEKELYVPGGPGPQSTQEGLELGLKSRPAR